MRCSILLEIHDDVDPWYWYTVFEVIHPPLVPESPAPTFPFPPASVALVSKTRSWCLDTIGSCFSHIPKRTHTCHVCNGPHPKSLELCTLGWCCCCLAWDYINEQWWHSSSCLKVVCLQSLFGSIWTASGTNSELKISILIKTSIINRELYKTDL